MMLNPEGVADDRYDAAHQLGILLSPPPSFTAWQIGCHHSIEHTGES
jgi:hypothetical protein